MAYNHYYLPMNRDRPAVSLNARILYSGSVRNDPEWFNAEHCHQFCEILYIVRGSGTIRFGDQAAKSINEGNLIVLNPFVAHAETSSSENPLYMVFIAAEQFQINDLSPNFLLPSGRNPILETQGYKFKIEQIFTEIIRETSGMVTYYEEFSNLLLNELLLIVQRLLMADSVFTAGSNDESECARIKDYIDSNYASALTLESISENIYVSKHHLSHIFKEQVGISPIQYLLMRRMDEAAALLRDTDTAISEVAKIVGYVDLAYFSQSFKRIKGVSPRAFRRNCQMGAKD